MDDDDLLGHMLLPPSMSNHVCPSNILYFAVSMLHKGILLESILGTNTYVFVVFQLIILCRFVHVLLAWPWHHWFVLDPPRGDVGLTLALATVLFKDERLPRTDAMLFSVYVPTVMSGVLDLLSAAYTMPGHALLPVVTGVLTGWMYVVLLRFIRERAWMHWRIISVWRRKDIENSKTGEHED